VTLQQAYTLGEVIREALDALPGAAVRDVVNWIRENHRSVVEDNFETLSYQGLSVMVRAARKSRAPSLELQEYSHSLCFDFGLSPMLLDHEISVPRDMENLINSPCDWPVLEEATLLDLDKHIALLRATGAATLAQAERCAKLRQGAVRYSPNGRLDLTIGALREMARAQRNRN
jgi:hypothetical protein